VVAVSPFIEVVGEARSQSPSMASGGVGIQWLMVSRGETTGMTPVNGGDKEETVWCSSSMCGVVARGWRWRDSWVVAALDPEEGDEA
jgi:hypothetical protein